MIDHRWMDDDDDGIILARGGAIWSNYGDLWRCESQFMFVDGAGRRTGERDIDTYIVRGCLGWWCERGLEEGGPRPDEVWDIGGGG